MHARRVRRPAENARAERRPPPTWNSAVRNRTSARAGARPAALAPDDIRRTIAAAASAVIPGLGQLINDRMRLARWFAIPALVLLAVAALLVAANSPARLFATLISPTAMSLLLTLNVVVLVWRLASVAHAFFDGRYAGRSGRVGAAGLAFVLIAVAVPHGIANAWGNEAQAAFRNVFAGSGNPGPGREVASTNDGPGPNERVNILLVGVDSFPGRTEKLTDTLMVVSIDPIGRTVSMISMPRDIVMVPLGNGDDFGPKINSLMSYADRHPKDFPEGGMRTLEQAIGTMLGIRIDYYARIDFIGFVQLIDSVGGVDVNVTRAFYDPKYDGLGVNEANVQGWGVEVGPQHFNGYEALAYARSRYALGESDFTRAARQQEILLALRTRLMSAGSLLSNVPSMLAALGDLLTSDLPTSRLPDLAAIADELGPDSIYRMVLGHPLVLPANDPRLGSVQTPDLPAIRAAVAGIVPPPGQIPVAWPTAAPAEGPNGGASPAP
ncbi:MAG: LCP family protein [Chloroflexota bacterium]